MICALCGPTEFPVTMRSFKYAGQVTYLVVCDTCADHAQVKLAKAESRAWPGHTSSTENDVKPDDGACWADRRAGTGKRRPKRKQPERVPGRVGARFKKGYLL